MMQTALAITAGVLAGIGGWRYAASLQAEAARLQRWVELLTRLHLILGERSCAMSEALRLAADDRAAPDLMMQRLADGLITDPLLPLSDHFDQLCDDCTEKHELARMFSRLGRGSLESRLLAMEQASQELQLRHHAAVDRSAKDAALWQKLGWIAGACLTLMLI